MTVVEARLRQMPDFAVASHGLALDHVVDFHLRYPGEPVTFYTRVSVVEPVPGFKLQIQLPPELAATETYASENHGDEIADIVSMQDGQIVVWRVERDLEPGDVFEYRLVTLIGQPLNALEVESRALLFSEISESERVSIAETAFVSVRTKSKYLRYLPMLYDEDELMPRFLMLFESFWAPIEDQIENIAHYFDPKMTTADMLPFLASWVDLALDDRWPEERQRNLLLSAAQLHRNRGTKDGMREMLEVYTDGEALITEHTAKNFRIGSDAFLGKSIALGISNRPHTFSVKLRLPPVQVEEGEDVEQQERERELAIRELIDVNKPAHTTFKLTINLESGEAHITKG